MSHYIRISLFIITCSWLAACAGLGSYHGKSLANIGANPPHLSENPIPKIILVIGGTSGIGLEVVKLSLDRGHKVTAVARRPERMTLVHPSLTVLKGDITDQAAMLDIMPNHEVVVSAIGISPTSKKVTVFSDGMKKVLVAMDKHSVHRLITVTAVGVGNSAGHGGFIFDNLLNSKLVLGYDITDKSVQENLIRQSQTRWTIVRPSILSNGKSNIKYRVLTDLDGIEAGGISRTDVAHFIVASFEDELYIKQAVLLSN